jgi:hypothetical protein
MMSISLSGPASSRTTDPKKYNAFTWKSLKGILLRERISTTSRLVTGVFPLFRSMAVGLCSATHRAIADFHAGNSDLIRYAAGFGKFKVHPLGCQHIKKPIVFL